MLFASYKRFGDAHREIVQKIPGAYRVYKAGYRLLKPKGNVLVPTASGMRFHMNATDDVMVPHLLAYGVHEPAETALLERVLTPEMTMLDLGANVGYFSVLASRLAKKVFAFEPEPRNYALLLDNIRENEVANVMPISCAISNQTGMMRLYLDKFNFGGHTLGADNVQTSADGYINIPTVTLDAFISSQTRQSTHSVHVDFLKMDVQGAEGQVIEGGERTLRDNDVKILMEYWPDGLRKMGTHPLDLLEKLRSWGFSISAVEPNGARRMDDLSALLQQAETNSYVNLFLEKG